jgi:hypothetical protein
MGDLKLSAELQGRDITSHNLEALKNGLMLSLCYAVPLFLHSAVSILSNI